MFYFGIGDSKNNWKDYSLIVPAVSVGNVGQLTADLIISTLDMIKVGYIYDGSIAPAVGNDPFAPPCTTSCNLVTSCEVYQCVEKQLVVIQQRSPFIKGKRPAFRKRLVEWIHQEQFCHVIILTSSYSHERLDVQLEGSQFRFLTSPKMEAKIGNIIRHSLKWMELERRHSFPAPSPHELGDHGLVDSIYIPGGGIAKKLFEDCFEDTSVLVLLMFCAEGDNAAHAVQLASQLNQWLRLVNNGSQIKKTYNGQVSRMAEWKVPDSWRLTFGSKFDPTLFH